MNTEHTKGPWKVDTKGRFWSIESTQCEICAMPDMDGREATPNEQANARLIAAAPELLAALEHIVSEIAGGGDMSAATVEHLGSIARAAITRATGH